MWLISVWFLKHYLVLFFQFLVQPILPIKDEKREHTTVKTFIYSPTHPLHQVIAVFTKPQPLLKLEAEDDFFPSKLESSYV